MPQSSFSLFCLCFLFQCICWNSSAASEAEPFNPYLDKLERQLELHHHTHFLAKKNDADSVLSPFTSDGCSGGLSVGWQYISGKIEQFQNIHGTLPPWEECCITHDKAYHTGGLPQDSSSESFEKRKEADLALKNCVLDTGAKRSSKLIAEYNITETELHYIYQSIADMMYRAVRIGGVPCSTLPWRWGYGWPQCD